MTLEQAVHFFGNKSRLAAALDIRPQSVQDWEANGKIPETRQYQIQVLTGGELIADGELTAVSKKGMEV